MKNLCYCCLLISCLMPGTGNSQAIPNNPDAPLFLDYQKVRTNHLASLLVKSFQQHGHRDKAWNEDAEKALKYYAIVFQMRLTKEASQPLRELTSKCRDQGCRDPLVDLAWRKSGAAPKKKRPGFQQLLLDAERRGYPPEVTIFIGSRYAGSVMRKNFNPPESFAQQLTAYFSSAAARKVPRFSHNQINSIARKLELIKLARLIKEAENNPAGDDEAYHLMLGACCDRIAWAVRGGGTIDTVSEKAYAMFTTYQEKAYRHYHSAWTLEPSRATAPAQLISIAGAIPKLGRGQQLLWFNRTVKAELDNPTAYNTIIHYSLPRWGGTLHGLVALAKLCAETRRYDTSVPRYVRVILKQLINKFDGNRRMLENPACYDLVARVVNDLESGDYEVNLNLYRLEGWKSLQALLAFASGNLPETKRIAAELGDKIVPGVFKEFSVSFDEFNNVVTGKSEMRKPTPSAPPSFKPRTDIGNLVQ